jgi:multiple sugar transport system permease protein
VWFLLLAFALASVIPMIWLFLAPSKTAEQLNNDHPFSFGSFANYGQAWEHLNTFQNGVIVNWLINSVAYTAAILVLSCGTAMAAGFALAADGGPVQAVADHHHAGRDDHPAGGARAPAVHPDLADRAVRHPGRRHPDQLVLPVRRLPRLHLLLQLDPARDLRVRQGRRRGEFRIFWSIALPLSKGLLGMLAFFSFSATWANYFLPYVLLGSAENYTFPGRARRAVRLDPRAQPQQRGAAERHRSPEIAWPGCCWPSRS